MDSFAKIFINYQKIGKAQKLDSKSRSGTYHSSALTLVAEKRKIEEKLAPWKSPISKGRLRADIDGDKFTIK